MSAGLYLSRARLRHDVPTTALRQILANLAGTRAAAAHRLIWSLFGDDPDRRRDFLWREAEPGTFYLLSARPPAPHELFHLEEPKPFSPELSPGDELHFVLRANATVSRKSKTAEYGSRGKRCDIVMDAIHELPRGERAEPRRTVQPEVAAQWLAAQGAVSGFEIKRRDHVECWEAGGPDSSEARALEVTGYQVITVGRSRGRTALRLGVLDLAGTVVVREPSRFVHALGHGFGRGKAFGCGLMLVRRAG